MPFPCRRKEASLHQPHLQAVPLRASLPSIASRGTTWVLRLEGEVWLRAVLRCCMPCSCSNLVCRK